jgi:signal transduction histidine kinase
MDQEQSPAEQRIKSEGEPGRSHYSEGAIVLHVESRVGMGVSPRQFVSEFRALRATVVRLWQRDSNEIDNSSLDDMIRFNEAID